MYIGDLAISLQGSLPLLALFLIVGISVAIFFYRYTLPPIPPFRKWSLTFLRAGSVSLLLLLMFEPILHIIHHNEQQPIIAVLVDNSQSMSIQDESGTRSLEVKRWMNSETVKNLTPSASVKYFSFASSLSVNANGSPDSVKFSGETTNLSQALAGLKEQLAKDNIQGAVLLSDGNYNVGKNPTYDAEGLGIPLFTVGVGDTAEQKDVLVERVVTNSLAYAETQVPVDIAVKSSGYKDERVEITLAQGGTVVDRKVITLGEGTQEYPVKLVFEPHEEGMMKYTVSASKLPGELTDRNNTKSFYVKVLRSKLRLLLLAGAANPDVPAVRQALVEDGHFTVRSFVQKITGDFYEGVISRSSLDSADCLVLIGFPSPLTPNPILQQLTDVIDREKKPILFVNSKTTDYSKLKTIEQYLPFSWLVVSSAETYVFPLVAERYKAHPLVDLEGKVTADAWQQLPPV